MKPLLKPETRSDLLYEYDGELYPDYLKRGNAMQWAEPFAKFFCRGAGLDLGCGKWPLTGAQGIDYCTGGNACALPEGQFDYLASFHLLEHLADPVSALTHWQTRLKPGGVLFLYLPAHEMTYWQPTRNRKHLHTWTPEQMAWMLTDLGYVDVIYSGRDLAWSFAVVGWKPGAL